MQGLQSVMPFMLIMGFIFYFMLIRPQSKERKQRAAMLASVKKNDRVVTIGGIIGTVASVRDDEITLKVDESSNTKITFSRSAIQSVTPKEVGEKDKEAK
ncbi:MAG: preprotein translocase subunit YajC [Phycisphaerales bacterium]|nr:preprotein translocase subunit YajC [Phycisphaerales bacterium]MCB9862158.1 preprotein translocase subunit YajC [Phycisphaerales bacterium]